MNNTLCKSDKFPYEYKVVNTTSNENEISRHDENHKKEGKEEFSMDVAGDTKNPQTPYNPHEHRVLKNPTT